MKDIAEDLVEAVDALPEEPLAFVVVDGRAVRVALPAPHKPKAEDEDRDKKP